MSTYVYRYKTKDYPWLYVGKSDKNLKDRIRAHKKEKKFKPYLKECSIFYFELDNPAQSKFVESYLIDKYKPFLNYVDKYEGISPYNLNIPEWKPLKHYVKKNNISPTLLENKNLSSEASDNKRLKELKLEIRDLKSKINSYEKYNGFYQKTDGNEKYFEKLCHVQKRQLDAKDRQIAEHNKQLDGFLNIMRNTEEKYNTMMIHYDKMIRHYNELSERVKFLNGQNINLRNKIKFLEQ